MSASKFIVPSLLLLASCGEPQPAPELEDWSPGYPTNNDTSDTSNPTAPATVRAFVDMGQVLTRFGKKDDPTALCEIEPVEGQYQEVACQLEINELDLWAQGWTYNLYVAENTCEYLVVDNYYYQAWSLGDGPTTVEYQVDTDGNFLADVSNSLNGEPNCEFDHSNPAIPEAPNCCYGTYRVTEIVMDGATEVDRVTGDFKEWGGGQLAECYDGAAFSASTQAFEVNSGLPIPTLVDIDETGPTVYSVSFSSAESRQDKSTNVFHANFFDGATPVGLAAASNANPEYAVYCLDRDAEVTAKVTFTVREWNERNEYLGEGNPETGTQAAAGDPLPLEASGSGSPINDRFDWADFVLNGNDFVGWED